MLVRLRFLYSFLYIFAFNFPPVFRPFRLFRPLLEVALLPYNSMLDIHQEWCMSTSSPVLICSYLNFLSSTIVCFKLITQFVDGAVRLAVRDLMEVLQSFRLGVIKMTTLGQVWPVEGFCNFF